MKGHPEAPMGQGAMDGHPEALIDLGAIKDNVVALARHAAGAQVMAVVKSDGYGHGMIPAAVAALDGGAARASCWSWPGAG